MVIPNVALTTMANVASCTVAPNRSRKIFRVGSPHLIDVPKSPCIMPETYLQYWTYTG
jgi:hypothetical protein